jgi:DNA helicase-2/ATP-dependent DNA helicase PcrA
VNRQGASRLDLAKTLNPEQLAAVTHGTGPQLVLAGAGSGKTRVITYRIAWLVRERGVDPSAIAAVTFTNKAAGEMRERVENLLGLYPLPTFVGTFHRFALRLLRRWGEKVGLRHDFAILDAGDQLALIKQALAAENLAENAFPPRAVLAAISGAKNRLQNVDRYEAAAASFFEKRTAKVYRRYQGLLQKSGGVDFDDMLALAVELLRDEEVGERVRRRLQWLMVDEYQDTNHAQLALIRHLVGSDGNLTAVGDEDQGIYRWRGADLENILRFEASFPQATVRKLERNYRSTQTILDASGALVAHNEGRRGKRLWTEEGAGAPITVYQAADEEDEARWIVQQLLVERRRLKLAEMAILVRTNAQTRALEEELIRREVPYTLVGGVRFYERAEIKDLLAYLRVLRNPYDDLSLLRILNVPARGIGKATQEQLLAEAASRGEPLWDLIRHGQLATFAPRAASALTAFRDLVLGLQQAAAELPLPALLDRLLADTGYLETFRAGDPEDEARRENVQELLSAAQEFTEQTVARQDFATGAGSPGPQAAGADAPATVPRTFSAGEEDLLTAFLDHVALVADVDAWEEGRGVTVMTLHAAKGLEFPLVVVGGLEDGVLPHFNAGPSRDDLEEERRLLYVGMTRARTRLVLTYCRRRRIAGRYQDQMESPFLAEIPERFLELQRSRELWAEHRPLDRRAASVLEFFGGGGAGGGNAAGQASWGGGGAGGSGRDRGRRLESDADDVPTIPADTPRAPVRPVRPPAGVGGGSTGAGGWGSPPAPSSRPGGAAAGAGAPAFGAASRAAAGERAARELRKGSRVRHPTLGEGVVLELEGSGDEGKITVYFQRAGKRKLVARYASLELL